MKLIKIKDDHYVVVDNSEIKDTDYVFNTLHKVIAYGPSGNFYDKKITHSTQPVEPIVTEDSFKSYDFIPLQEVQELIGEMDVESDAEEWAWIYNQGENGKEYFKIAKEAYIAAYNQCLEDNEEYIKKSTEWEVELETIDNRELCNCNCHRDSNTIHFVACCNDGFKGKVTQKLKLI